MKSLLRRFVCLSIPMALLLTCLFCAASQVGALKPKTSASPLRPADETAQARVNEAYGKLPLSFEINQWQADSQVKFLARDGDYGLFLSDNKATLRLQSGKYGEKSANVSLNLIGANTTPRVEGVDALPGKSNYLIGNNASKWRTGIANFAKVRYREIYRGIDLVYYGNQRQLEYDFVVSPGASPRAIRLSFEGARKIRVDTNGDLILRLAEGELRQSKPVVYQEVNGAKRMVSGRYVVKGNQVGFEIGRYDQGRELVIDPVLNYLARLTPGKRIALDGQGNAYIIADVISSVNGEKDILVMKLNPTGTQMVYNTILGGRLADTPADITVDAQGNVTLLANSSSPDFPGATGAASGVYALRLSADGMRPVFSALVASGEGRALARDAAGNIYVAGTGRLQTLLNALQTTQGAGFVARLNGQTQQTEYATYLPAPPIDLAADRTGKIAIVGRGLGNEADSLIKNGFQPTSKGSQDVFICRIDPQRVGADSLLFGSYLGGQVEETVNAVAVDANGMIYVTGQTQSPDFPTTPGAQIAGAGSYYLVKVDPGKSGASSLLWATGLGGAIVTGLAVDAIGNVYITGATFGGIPVTPGALQSGLAGGACLIFKCTCDLVTGFCPVRCQSFTPGTCSDAFMTKLSADGSATLYSTYLGTAAEQTYEGANDIAVDQAGNVYLIGVGQLPATTGAFQLTGGSGFLAKLTLGTRSTAVATVSAANYQGPQLASESLAVSFLDAFGAGSDNLKVKVADSAGIERDAQVFFSGFGQVNFQIPPGTANGDALVSVTSGGALIASGATQIVKIAPGVFSADASGRGLTAAIAQRVKPDNTVTYEAIYRFDPAQNKLVAIPIDFGPEDDRMFLAIFGTGLRFRSSEAAVKVTVSGVEVPVTYAGLQPTFTGLDQINVQLPRTLAGKGEVDVDVTIDGKVANTTRVNIK